MHIDDLLRIAIERKGSDQDPDVILVGRMRDHRQTFDQSLYDLFSEGLVSYETALENASNPDDFKLKVQGIHSTADPACKQMEQVNFSARKA